LAFVACQAISGAASPPPVAATPAIRCSIASSPPNASGTDGGLSTNGHGDVKSSGE
jgi:hypothetical protein